MNRLQAAKAAAGGVNRALALALALRSPQVAAALAKSAPGAASASRHGQRANPVPLTRNGKPNS